MNNFQAGHYVQCSGYKAFIPSKINKEFICNDSKILALLEKASRYIGELNAYSKNLPNIFFFLSMMAIDEATFSNKIEGTRITLNEVVSPDEEILPERRDEKTEVLNYLYALSLSYKTLTGYENILISPEKANDPTLPFCTRLIKKAHKYLLEGSRGKDKHPGEFRKSQNWIGGTMPSTAAFVPPPPERCKPRRTYPSRTLCAVRPIVLSKAPKSAYTRRCLSAKWWVLRLRPAFCRSFRANWDFCPYRPRNRCRLRCRYKK